jgi:hypothetical protein
MTYMSFLDLPEGDGSSGENWSTLEKKQIILLFLLNPHFPHRK